MSKLRRKQEIGLKTVSNARELGGYRTTDGRIVKTGKIIRCGDLNDLNEEDKKKLCELALKMVIDFRSAGEIRLKPDVKIAGVDYVTIDILKEDEHIGKDREGEELPLQSLMEVAVKKYGKEHAAQRSMADLYKDFVEKEMCRQGYREFFELALLIDPEKGALLYHCAQGKDRTGIASVLLLSALGVERETIVEDYLLTNDFIGDEMVKFIDNVAVNDEEYKKMLLYYMQVHKTCIDAYYEAIEENYGNMTEYLYKECGLDQASIKQLKEIYTK